MVTRETTSPDWTDAIGVGNVTTVTLDIAKDNVQFGVPWTRMGIAVRSPSRR